MSVTTLESAVAEAVKSNPSIEEIAESEQNTQAPPSSETPKVESEVTEQEIEEVKELVDEYGLDELNQRQAKQLYLALNDPARAPKIIEFIVKNNPAAKIVETKTEATEAKDEIYTALEETLGKDVADRLSPAINKLVNKQLKENTDDLRSRLETQELTKINKESEDAYIDLGKTYFDGKSIPDDVATEMSKLIDKRPPRGDMSVQEYLEETLFIAMGRKGIGITKGSKSSTVNNDKIVKNRNDAPDRLASTRGSRPALGSPTKPFRNLNDAVADAMEKVSKDYTK